MSELVELALFLFGAVLTVVGVAQWSEPAAWIAAGGWLIVLACWRFIRARLFGVR